MLHGSLQVLKPVLAGPCSRFLVGATVIPMVSFNSYRIDPLLQITQDLMLGEVFPRDSFSISLLTAREPTLFDLPKNY